MTTVFVDLVNLDGSRPEGSLRFSLERLVLGDPDIVPSAVEARIRDGKARIENLLPGAMRVRVNAGCWSKDWQVTIPAEGEHDLLDLLEWQADDFQETVWAELNRRVEVLESAPAVDLSPLEKRVEVLESRPEPEPFDPTALQAENQALKQQVEQLQAHLKPVRLDAVEEIFEDVYAIYDTGAQYGIVQQGGRVEISIRAAFNVEDTLKALSGLQLPHFPTVSAFNGEGYSTCDVSFYDGAKFLTKLEPNQIFLTHVTSSDKTLNFAVALDDALQVAQEVGANRMFLTTYYYTTDLPPVID